MFDSLKLSDLHSYATVIAVIAIVTFIVMLFIQAKYNKRKLKRLSVKNFQTESEVTAVKQDDETEQIIECTSYKPKEADKTEKSLHAASIGLRIICGLLILSSMGLIFYTSMLNKMALANGAYDNIQNSQTIREMKDDIKYGFEESEDIPSDLTGCIVIFYRYGCPDCKAIHDDLMKAIESHKDNKIYFVSTRSDKGRQLLHPDGNEEKYLVNDVPAIVYYQTYGSDSQKVKKSILYTFDDKKNPVFDSQVFDIIIRYQNGETK